MFTCLAAGTCKCMKNTNQICRSVSEVSSFVGKAVQKNRCYTDLQWIFNIHHTLPISPTTVYV